ncbi:MAG: TIR domain-containing protein [Candidatus Lokiarchaeota archaeon]|nr:TIR domain-containing protein [Candidatus Lokiarchaeota archaeon]
MMLEIGNIIKSEKSGRKYKIKKKIFNNVVSEYKVIDEEKNQPYILKVFEHTYFSNEDEQIEMWQMDIKCLKLLKNYKRSLIKYVEDFKVKRKAPKDLNLYCFIVLEWIELTTLKSWLNENLRSKPEDQLHNEQIIERIIIPLCDLLDFFHKNGIVYRNLNFLDIFLNKRNNPCLLRWLWCVEPGTEYYNKKPPKINDIQKPGEVLMHPGFFSPEVINHKQAVPQTDIYCLGAVMFFLFTNGYTRERPTQESEYQLHPIDYNMNISQELNQIIEKCTNYEPPDRYVSMSELIHQLKKLLAYSQKNKTIAREMKRIKGTQKIYEKIIISNDLDFDQLDSYAVKVLEFNKKKETMPRPVDILMMGVPDSFVRLIPLYLQIVVKDNFDDLNRIQADFYNENVLLILDDTTFSVPTLEDLAISLDSVYDAKMTLSYLNYTLNQEIVLNDLDLKENSDINRLATKLLKENEKTELSIFDIARFLDKSDFNIPYSNVFITSKKIIHLIENDIKLDIKKLDPIEITKLDEDVHTLLKNSKDDKFPSLRDCTGLLNSVLSVKRAHSYMNIILDDFEIEIPDYPSIEIEEISIWAKKILKKFGDTKIKATDCVKEYKIPLMQAKQALVLINGGGMPSPDIWEKHLGSEKIDEIMRLLAADLLKNIDNNLPPPTLFELCKKQDSLGLIDIRLGVITLGAKGYFKSEVCSSVLGSEIDFEKVDSSPQSFRGFMGDLTIPEMNIAKKIEEEQNRLSNAFISSTMEDLAPSKIKDFKVFMSYALADSKELKVKEISELLGKQKGISEVLYWEGWGGNSYDGDLVDFMEKGVKDSSIFIAFCTKESRKSENCEKERKMAFTQNKRIIPMFISFSQVPPGFQPYKGINIKNKDVKEIVDELTLLLFGVNK